MRKKNNILFFGHEASRTGAPIFLLHLLRWLRAEGSVDFELVLKKPDGPLATEYAKLTKVHSIESLRASGDPRRFDAIYSNTLCNGPAVDLLGYDSVPVVTHVHELDFGFAAMGARFVACSVSQTSHFIACAERVSERLQQCFGVPKSNISVQYEMINVDEVIASARSEQPAVVRKRHGIPDDALVVAACGTFDSRKGPDLLLQVALSVRRALSGPRPIRFLWLGKISDEALARVVSHDMKVAGMQGEFVVTGELASPYSLLGLADVFCLTSRDDPFPLAMLEAAALGVPILCFESAGGAPEFCAHGGGVAVPYLDTRAMADRCVQLLSNEAERLEIGCRAAESVRHHFDVRAIAPGMAGELRQICERLSLNPSTRRRCTMSDAVSKWSLEEAPQADFVQCCRNLENARKAARTAVRNGRREEAVSILNRMIKSVSLTSKRAALEILIEVCDELATIDSASAKVMLAQGERYAKAWGGGDLAAIRRELWKPTVPVSNGSASGCMGPRHTKSVGMANVT